MASTSEDISGIGFFTFAALATQGVRNREDLFDAVSVDVPQVGVR